MPYKAPSPSNAWTCTLNQSAVSADQSQPFQLTFGDELVFNLDKIASGFIKKLYGNKTLSSVDAFKEKDGEFYFIEFKNQPQKNIDSNSVRAKAFSSLVVLQFALHPELSLAEISEKAHFYVVFQDDPQNYFEKTTQTIAKYAGFSDEPIYFDLRKYYFNNKLYKDIHTVSFSVFESKYIGLIFP